MNLADIIDEATGSHRGDMFRARPYDGQAHTDHGDRGKQEVCGITMRDVRDCFVRAIALASGPGALYDEAQKGERANICENDLYAVDWGQMDIIAVQQALTCEIERIMGIYPNLPKHFRRIK